MRTIARSALIGTVLFAGSVQSIAEPVWVSRNLTGGASDGSNIAYDMTPDGRYVLFFAAGDDMVAGDSNQAPDLILRDLTTNTNELISPGASLGSRSISTTDYQSAMSADGRYVVFESTYSNVIPGVSSDVSQVYLSDRVLQQTFLISANDDGDPLEDESFMPAVSDDGRYVAFSSNAASISNGEDTPRTYLYDRVTGERRIVTRNRGGDPLGVVGNIVRPSMSGSGRWMAFATNPLLPEAGTNRQVYLYDREDDSLRIISRTPSGVMGDGISNDALISRDGRYVVFVSGAPNLTGQPDRDWQVLRLDLTSGAIENVDVDRDGEQQSNGNPLSDPPRVAHISSTGRFISFGSAKRLTPGIEPFLLGGGFVRDMDERRTLAGNIDLLGRRRGNPAGKLSDDGRSMLVTGAGTLYPAGVLLPDTKGYDGAYGTDVFVQDLSPVEVELKVSQTALAGNVEVVISNHGSLQASVIGLQITSTRPLLFLGPAPVMSCGPVGASTPSECWIPLVRAGEQLTFQVVFDVSNLTADTSLDIVLHPNELDPNTANNSGRVTFAGRPPPPPPPPTNGGGSGGGGGGTFGWLSLASLGLLLARRVVQSRKV